MIGLIVRAVCLAAILVVAGCKNAPTTAYRVSGASHATVTTAMKAWNEYVGKYHPPVKQEEKVRDAYNKYRTASVAVLDTAIAYKRASDANQPLPADALNTAIATASAALAGLVSVIQSFGVTIN